MKDNQFNPPNASCSIRSVPKLNSMTIKKKIIVYHDYWQCFEVQKHNQTWFTHTNTHARTLNPNPVQFKAGGGGGGGTLTQHIHRRTHTWTKTPTKNIWTISASSDKNLQKLTKNRPLKWECVSGMNTKTKSSTVTERERRQQSMSPLSFSCLYRQDTWQQKKKKAESC